MKRIIYLLFGLILFSGCGIMSGGGCGKYGPWRYESTECKRNFWCFRKRQKATYKKEYKEKECKKGIVRRYRSKKVRCGCN